MLASTRARKSTLAGRIEILLQATRTTLTKAASEGGLYDACTIVEIHP